ncbi:MAG: NAD(P)/FAD-dependent oxidoreductase [Candidatus Anstonellales archaeon]
MEEYDVLVIGSGPAGSTFARIVAPEREVLVVDKRKQVGVPVRCGEGLGAREVLAQGLELPKHVISTEILGAKVVGPRGEKIVWKDEETKGWVLERKAFDQWLAELATKKGAKIKVYTRALDIKRDGDGFVVKLQHGADEPYEVKAKLVVSAEGMEAHIARKMGFNAIHSLYDVDTCYEYEMAPYNHENLIELYFGNNVAPRGYVWIFPKADKKANVGIGIGAHLVTGKKRGGLDGATPRTFLDRFIQEHSELRDASIYNDFGGIISVGAPMDSFVKDNFLVVGTAAKQVDPIHGGGIALAMEAAALAGNAALRGFHEKNLSADFLYTYYEKPWRETAGKKMAKRLLLRKVLEKLNDDDLSHIFSTIADSDLNQVMKGNFAGPVAKAVAGRPQLLKVLSALLG